MDKRFGTPADHLELRNVRISFDTTPGHVTSGDFTEADEPLRLFAAWFSEASRSEPADPNAMTLADRRPRRLAERPDGAAQGFDEQGFVFYTNLDSQKGRELDGIPKGALVFHWKSLSRQVRLRGPVERVEDQVADAYSATRPRLPKSAPGPASSRLRSKSRMAFEKAVALHMAKFAVRNDTATGELVPATGCCPRSSNSGKIDPIGYTIAIEFRRNGAGEPWSKTRLYP